MASWWVCRSEALLLECESECEWVGPRSESASECWSAEPVWACASECSSAAPLWTCELGSGSGYGSGCA